MITKSLATAATVAAITIGAMSAATAPAQAGVKVYFNGGWGHGHAAPIHYYGHGYRHRYRNPCRHWKRKYHRTGRYWFLRKYRRCMRRYYY